MTAPTAATAATLDEEVRICVEERVPDPDDALTPTWENFQAARQRFFAGITEHSDTNG